MKQLIKESIIEIFKDREFVTSIFKPIYDRLDLHRKNSEKVIESLLEKIDCLEERIDDIYQAEKVNNICIHGITDEKQENITLKTLNILNNAVPNISASNMSAYRIGKEVNNGKSRPVIVKFDNIMDKRKVLKSLKNFKGSKIFICEDLTRLRLDLLNAAKVVFGKTSVWSFGGNVYANVDGNAVRIKNKLQLLQYQKQ